MSERWKQEIKMRVMPGERGGAYDLDLASNSGR